MNVFFSTISYYNKESKHLTPCCMLFCHMWIFFKLIFSKKIFPECHQSVRQFRSRSGLTLLGLIWVQTICKIIYHQTIKVTTSRERVKCQNVYTRVVYKWNKNRKQTKQCSHNAMQICHLEVAVAVLRVFINIKYVNLTLRLWWTVLVMTKEPVKQNATNMSKLQMKTTKQYIHN